MGSRGRPRPCSGSGIAPQRSRSKRQKGFFLCCLSCVVGWPVLRVRDTDSSGNGSATVLVGLALHRELDRESVLALHLAQFVIRTGAMIAVLAQRHGIAPVERLRGNDPSVALLHDLCHCRYFESALFPCVYCRLLICITIVGILAAQCQLVDLTIHWTYSVGMKRRKPKGERKEEELRLRLTTSQKEAFTKAAQRAGLDLSNWLRSIAVRAAESDQSSIKE